MNSSDKSTIYEDAFTYDQIHSPLGNGKDFKFYSDISKGKQVLEIACGSGRLTIPLAQNGVNITGLDISYSMLEEARSKSQQNGVNIKWIQADCTHFSLDKKFDLIFMTCNSLQHLKAANQILLFFDCVRKHLNPSGIFAFDIHRPDLTLLSRNPESRFFIKKYKNRAEEEVVLEESNSYDEINQTNIIKWFHLISGQLSKVDTLEMRQFFPREVDLLLQHAKFEILESYGDWDKNPISAQNFKQIFITRPT